jgi:hypothetical protein
MMGQRGQASVELAAAAPLVLLAAVALAQLVVAVSAADRAHRIAGAAAALTAEGRPLPAELRREARIEVTATEVRVDVGVPRLLPLVPPASVHATVRLP